MSLADLKVMLVEERRLGGEAALLKEGRLLGPAPPAELLTAPTLEGLYGTPIEVVALTEGRAKGQVLCVPVMPC